MNKSAYIQPRRVAVKRVDEIEVGAVYVIVGTTRNPDYKHPRFDGYLDEYLDLPPVVVQVTGPPWVDFIAGDYAVPVHIWMFLGEWMVVPRKGEVPIEFDSMLFLSGVNVPENGVNDHHLERFSDDLAVMYGFMKEKNRKDDYGEKVGFRRGRY